MLPTAGDLLVFVVAFAAPCAVVLVLMPRYIRFLTSKGRLADDAHRQPPTRVPTPAGPLLILGLILGELAIYALHESTIPLAVIAVAAVAGAVGLYDDLKGLGGVVKPALTMGAAIPLIWAQQVHQTLYNAQLWFPFFNNTGTHYIIFAVLVLGSMPVASNAFNMLDAFNGEISGFTFLVSLALVAGILMEGLRMASFDYLRLAAVLPLAAVSLGFYFYNRYPARVFDGDSGSLVFGATYAALAIMGGVEIAALVAVIPAVINSYYIIVSVRGFVEHKRMSTRPTYMGEDGKLYASTQSGAPTTLARLILRRSPLSEKDLVKSILTLTAFACVLSIVTSAVTWLL